MSSLIQRLNLPEEVAGPPDLTRQLAYERVAGQSKSYVASRVLAFCLIDGSVELAHLPKGERN